MCTAHPACQLENSLSASNGFPADRKSRLLWQSRLRQVVYTTFWRSRGSVPLTPSAQVVTLNPKTENRNLKHGPEQKPQMSPRKSVPAGAGRRASPLFCSKVDGCVPHTQHVNLRIVCQPADRKCGSEQKPHMSPREVVAGAGQEGVAAWLRQQLTPLPCAIMFHMHQQTLTKGGITRHSGL
jgi:hypothetical protein